MQIRCCYQLHQNLILVLFRACIKLIVSSVGEVILPGRSSLELSEIGHFGSTLMHSTLERFHNVGDRVIKRVYGVSDLSIDEPECIRVVFLLLFVHLIQRFPGRY
jgi:hypothetical protein